MTCWRGCGSAPPPCPPCCPGETGACSPPPVHAPRHTGNSLRVQRGGMGVCAASGTFAAAESAPGRRAARSAPPNCGGTCCAAGCAPVDSRVGTAVRFRVLKCACSTLCDALGRLWQSPLYVIDPAANVVPVQGRSLPPDASSRGSLMGTPWQPLGPQAQRASRTRRAPG